jgi:WD40 repeat protein
VTPDVVVTGSADGTAIASSVPAGERLWTASCAGFVNALCCVADAVVTGTSDGQLAVWDARTGAARAVLRASGREVQHACTVDDDHFAVIQRAADWDSSTVAVWSVLEGRAVASAELAPLGDRARRLVASPDGRRLYVGTNGSLVLVFERSMGVPSQRS